MQPQELCAAIAGLLEHSPVFPERPLEVDIIANPLAGGFTRRGYSNKRRAELATLAARAKELPLRKAPANVRIHLTEGRGHAAELVRGLIARARQDEPGVARFIMTAGGDGTALEAASALVELPAEDGSRFSLLRLPMGTGNDGAEGRDLVACLGRLLKPARRVSKRALRVLPNPAGGKSPRYCFNIASIGLDAFVADMTNKLKSFFPGDFYKLWVDIGAVFYDKLWPVKPLSLRALDEAGRTVVEMRREFLLIAMGVSGCRQYGANKPILPDDDNVCAIFQMPLLKKLAFKDRLSSGGHRGLGEDIVRLFSAARLELNYDSGIIMQRDGEVDELGPQDFPLTFELLDPCYNILEAD